MAVLIYHEDDIKKFISLQGFAFIDADTEKDATVLRNLHQKTHVGSYSLVVATSEEAMRGIDYRSPEVGITLIVGKSFKNTRESQQGLKRVGRYSDPCQRLLLEGVPLVDPQQELAYKKELLSFCRLINDAHIVHKLLGAFEPNKREEKKEAKKEAKKNAGKETPV